MDIIRWDLPYIKHGSLALWRDKDKTDGQTLITTHTRACAYTWFSLSLSKTAFRPQTLEASLSLSLDEYYWVNNNVTAIFGKSMLVWPEQWGDWSGSLRGSYRLCWVTKLDIQTNTALCLCHIHYFWFWK